MKKILSVILLLFAANAHAGFITGLIVGSALSSSNSTPNNAKPITVSGAAQSCTCTGADTSQRTCEVPLTVQTTVTPSGHWYTPDKVSEFHVPLPYGIHPVKIDNASYNFNYRPAYVVSYEDAVKLCSKGEASVVKDIAYVYDYRGSLQNVILEW